MENSRKTKGILYYNRGNKCLIRLVVSLFSLRKHWDGEITVVQDGPVGTILKEALTKNFRVSFIESRDSDVATLVRKIQISMLTPYNLTVYLDSDTIVVKPFDELFEEASKHDFVFVRFADWRSDGRVMSKRIRAYEKKWPDYVKKAVSYGPAINTGVYAYRKDSPLFGEWFDVAQWGSKQGFWIPDEIAAQILAPQFNCKVMPGGYNASCRYHPENEPVIISHYHGRKHVCSKLAHYWLDAFEECVLNDICGIRSLCREDCQGDRRLRKFLAGKYENKERAKRLMRMIAETN